MTITGRLTADAVVNETKNGRNVVNFSVAVNETYRPTGGDRVQVTTYFACSFWRTEKVAAFLKKGTLLEVNGRIEVRGYVSKQGEPKAGLNCHVTDFKVLAWSKEITVIGTALETPADTTGDGSDVPF